MTSKSNNFLKGLHLALLVVALGLNWGGFQLGVWAASCLGDARQFTFDEAFKHSLAGSGLSQDDQNCLCVSCQLTESKDDDQEDINEVLSLLSFLTQTGLAGVQVNLYFESVDNWLVGDFNHRLTSMNSPPQSPPPQAFV